MSLTFYEAFKHCRVIELSHLIEEEMPVTTDHPYYYHNLWNAQKYGPCSNSYLMYLHEHTGTHVDAPFHFFPEMETIEKMPLASFVHSCVVMSFHTDDKKKEVTAEDIKTWEETHIEVKNGDAVFLSMEWSSNWGKRSPNQPFGIDWPGLSEDGADYLVSKGVSMVGTEAFSIDSARSADLPAHKCLLSKHIPIVECLCSLEKLPDYCTVMMLPLPIKDGSASPVRVIALVED